MLKCALFLVSAFALRLIANSLDALNSFLLFQLFAVNTILR